MDTAEKVERLKGMIGNIRDLAIELRFESLSLDFVATEIISRAGTWMTMLASTKEEIIHERELREAQLEHHQA